MNENIIKIGNEKNYNYIYTQEIIENKIILKQKDRQYKRKN